MALLNTVLINTTPGLSYVNYPPQFLGLSIIAVMRTGIQQDRVIGADLNNGGTRQWALGGGLSLRIRFPSSMPFNDDEKVLVIYKPIL